MAGSVISGITVMADPGLTDWASLRTGTMTLLARLGAMRRSILRYELRTFSLVVMVDQSFCSSSIIGLRTPLRSFPGSLAAFSILPPLILQIHGHIATIVRELVYFIDSQSDYVNGTVLVGQRCIHTSDVPVGIL